MQILWLEISANYPLDGLFFFSNYDIWLWASLQWGSLPNGIPTCPWAVEVSLLTRHHKPIGFSFWLVFMLISHMGVPVPCDYWELRTQTRQISLGCRFLKNNSLYTHGQSGHQAFSSSISKTVGEVSLSCFMDRPTLHIAHLYDSSTLLRGAYSLGSSPQTDIRIPAPS